MFTECCPPCTRHVVYPPTHCCSLATSRPPVALHTVPVASLLLRGTL